MQCMSRAQPNKILAGFFAVLLALAAGCASTPAPSSAKGPAQEAAPGQMAEETAEGEPELPPEVQGAYIGEIVRVNAADGYVVVRCRRLPSAGEEARVERGQWHKGRIRFTQPMRAPFATADILRGEVDPGDQVLR